MTRPAVTKILITLAFSAATLSLDSTASFGAVEQQTKRTARCPRHLSTRAAENMRDSAKAFNRCHTAQMLGKLPAAPTLDCNDVSTWAAGGFQRGLDLLERKAQRMTRRTAGACADALPTEFTNCPAPCAGTIDSTADAASCMRCLAESCTAGAISRTYGQPPQVANRSDDAYRCQSYIGASLGSFGRIRMRAQTLCLFNQALGRLPDVDCADVESADHPDRRSFARRLAMMDNAMERRCGADPATLASDLDSCGTNPTEQASCVRDESQTCTNQILDALAGAATPEGCCAEPHTGEGMTPREQCFLQECRDECAADLLPFRESCLFCDTAGGNCETEACITQFEGCLPGEICDLLYQEMVNGLCVQSNSHATCIQDKIAACP